MMRWYVNDVSLQGQFANLQDLEIQIRNILSVRARFERIRTSLFATRTLRERCVFSTLTVREFVQRLLDRDLKRAMLIWLDRSGPFMEDERLPEPEDYFEYEGEDITDTGLGEAARRTRMLEEVATFSFAGGTGSFEVPVLQVDHGLAGDRLGRYGVDNLWMIEQLVTSAVQAAGEITSWKLLVEVARERYPRLLLPSSICEDDRLAREPFDAAIRDRTLILLSHLDRYMSARRSDGSEGELGRSIVRDFFTGDRALFSGESPSNQQKFRVELTFPDPVKQGRTIFAHWHGKISHRHFRLHFEWPVPADATLLKVVYLGPKLTKS